MKIVKTIPVSGGDTYPAALCFGAILAVDKGVPNVIREHAQGHAVLAEDGKAVLFTRGGTSCL